MLFGSRYNTGLDLFVKQFLSKKYKFLFLSTNLKKCLQICFSYSSL
nr:MAG TPA: hypothetical protein [Caudoviricetes sp.]